LVQESTCTKAPEMIRSAMPMTHETFIPWFSFI
jgi:hypothetical protein